LGLWQYKGLELCRNIEPALPMTNYFTRFVLVSAISGTLAKGRLGLERKVIKSFIVNGNWVFSLREYFGLPLRAFRKCEPREYGRSGQVCYMSSLFVILADVCARSINPDAVEVSQWTRNQTPRRCDRQFAQEVR
jgi:hypothetical protein